MKEGEEKYVCFYMKRKCVCEGSFCASKLRLCYQEYIFIALVITFFGY